MAIVNGYCTLAEIKARLGITDTASDAILENVVEAVSRAIDHATGDRFYVITAATYTFTPDYADWLPLPLAPGLRTVTTLKTDEDGDRAYETTWTTTDYDLEPENAAAFGQPYRAIRVAPNGTRAFPRGLRRSVQIAGDWGWAAIPDAINEACLLQSARLFRRKDAPFGVVGGGDLGEATVIPGGRRTRLDPDAEALVLPYRSYGLVAV